MTVHMKKILPLLFALIVLPLAACDRGGAHPSSTVDFAVDVENPREVVGFADYYFIGEVLREMETLPQGEGGALPYTRYQVQVVENIKGSLPQDEALDVLKAGGIGPQGEVLTYENDELLEVGKTYALAAAVQGAGSLLISGPNSSVVVEEAPGPQRYRKYHRIHEEEVPYNRERYEYAPQK
ncbi:MAG: hypothetical protein Q4E76_01785 [Tissierellia bacterium]|nr:hypothetical protein [Tissierellia bacterium]